MSNKTIKNRYQMSQSKDGTIKSVCRHCKREIDEIHELCTMMNGDWITIASGCEQCVHILGDKFAALHNAPLN